MLFNFILFSDSDVPGEEGFMLGLGLGRGPGPGPDTGAGADPKSGPDTGAGPHPKVADSAPNTEGTSGEAPTTQGTHDVTPKKPKGRKSHRINSEEEEDELLGWVKDNPCLWDARKRDFKDPEKKDKMWCDKASEKGYADCFHIQGWWKDMKDQYVKLDRGIFTRTRDAQFLTDRQKYILDKVAFYQPCCSHRRKAVSIQYYYFGLEITTTTHLSCIILSL